MELVWHMFYMDNNCQLYTDINEARNTDWYKLLIIKGFVHQRVTVQPKEKVLYQYEQFNIIFSLSFLSFSIVFSLNKPNNLSQHQK